MAMGDNEKKIFAIADRARPIIEAKANGVLESIGLNVSLYSHQVFLSGAGFETWTVIYWRTNTPKPKIGFPGELEVYLDSKANPLRAIRYENNKAVLIFGKETHIDLGMTAQEVLNRIGYPDTQRKARKNERYKADEVWFYYQSKGHPMDVEVWLKGSYVSWVSYTAGKRR